MVYTLNLWLVKGESLHCALLLDYVPPMSPEAYPFGNAHRDSVSPYTELGGNQPRKRVDVAEISKKKCAKKVEMGNRVKI